MKDLSENVDAIRWKVKRDNIWWCFFKIIVPVLGSCPSGWEKFDKNCYLFQDTDLQPWTVARYKCQNQGGNLASITSQQEQDFITFHYKQKAARNIWIGM